MLLPVYTRPALTIHRGEGCYLFDTNGRRYLDFISGVGVNALGHAHPRIVRAITNQAARVIHTSNLYHHDYQAPLARRLAAWSGLSHAFFSNSGAEAVETAIKAARAHGLRQHHGKVQLVALENSFHGRTCGALSVTGRPEYRRAFGPLLPEVRFIPANDIAALRAAVSEETAAILLEPIQGEGGVHVLEERFLREVRRLADAARALWIADETQCGLGRTGHYFAYQRFGGLIPDIVVTAKPLAAGLPIGATLFNETAATALPRGQHGSTFGGGPLVCRVALEVLDEVEQLLPHIRQTGAYLHRRLAELGTVRGEGMMAGIALEQPGEPIVARALEEGLMINCTHQTVLRFLPPYIATRAHVDEAMEVLERLLPVLAENGKSPYAIA
ncbi:MAG: acetylornithine/succinylornithine family transaminase [Acidobacteria bacterium]|nr:acetylornithine/succinylornithine family transaminase [Acidobacteriota bacterium]